MFKRKCNVYWRRSAKDRTLFMRDFMMNRGLFVLGWEGGISAFGDILADNSWNCDFLHVVEFFISQIVYGLLPLGMPQGRSLPIDR
jgi:hypothetical protein